jgi:PiT family inorganic phosphate transporter
MAVAWLVTLPAAALVGAVSASVVQHGGTFGTVVIALVAVAVASFIVAASRRNPVHASNVNDRHEVTVRTATPARRRHGRLSQGGFRRRISAGPHSARSPR